MAEGNDVAFTVTLTGGIPADDASVPFETSGTATVTDDYAAPKGAITFPPGDASGEAGVLEISAGQSNGTITFPVLADDTSENEETLKVEIFSVATDHRAGSVSATENIATTTILDQDNLTVSIEDAPSVTEGANATFTITLSTASDQAVSAGWSTKQAGDALDAGETALPDKDYTAASGTVAIPAGDRSATFTVTTSGDTLVEGEETFLVVLEEATIGNSSPPEMVPLLRVNQGGATPGDYSGVPQSVVFNSGDTLKTIDFEAIDDSTNDDGESVRISFGNLPDQVSAGTHSGTTVSITDDDVPSVTVSFEEASYSVVEGNTVVVKVVLSSDPERTVTVPITKTNQGGASVSDYSVPTSVAFNSGDTEKTFDFEATDDAFDDDGESVRLGFQNLPPGVSARSKNESTISITDDDTAGVTVSDTSLDIDEGDSDTYSVVLDSKPTHNVTITVNDPSNTDVTAEPPDLTFTPSNWDTAQTVTVAAAKDNGHDDEDGTVTHTAASTDTKYDGISVASVLVTVTDDDDVPVTVSFGSPTYTVAEGNTVMVKVKLSVDPERTVEVPITVTTMDGASSSDYSGVPANVVFNSGDTEKTFDFEAIQDTANVWDSPSGPFPQG